MRSSAPFKPPEEKYIPVLADVLDAAAGVSPDVRQLCAVLMLTGMRRGEVARLQWDDIVDFKVIHVKVNGHETSKRKARILPVTPLLATILCRADMSNGPCGLAPGRSGSNIAHAVAKVADAMGQPLTCNAMRRGRANTWMREYPGWVAQKFLGHSDAVARSHYLSAEEYINNAEVKEGD